MVFSAQLRSSRSAEQLAARFVPPFAHRPILGDVDRIGLALIFRQQSLRRVVRRMGQIGAYHKKNGLSPFGRQKVVDRLQAFAADFQTQVAMPAALERVAVRHAGREATLDKIPFPPFAASGS